MEGNTDLEILLLHIMEAIFDAIWFSLFTKCMTIHCFKSINALKVLPFHVTN